MTTTTDAQLASAKADVPLPSVTPFGITREEYYRIMEGRTRPYCDPVILPHWVSRDTQTGLLA